MVSLQFQVKFYRRKHAPSSGPLRSVLRNKETEDQDAPISPDGFMLSVAKPEKCSVARLACLISKEWTSLFPNREELEIERVIDDERPSMVLRAEMSVAQIWLDQGKARDNGWDQRGVVGVIQKPSIYAPQMFPSVDPTFAGAVQAERERLSLQVSPILEGPEPEGLHQTLSQSVEGSELSDSEEASESESEEPEESEVPRDTPMPSMEVKTTVPMPRTPSNLQPRPSSPTSSIGPHSSRKAANDLYMAHARERITKDWGTARTQAIRRMVTSYKTAQKINKLLNLNLPYDTIQLSINQQIVARLSRRDKYNQKSVRPIDLQRAAEVSNPLPLDPLLVQELGLGLDPDGFLGDENTHGPFPNRRITNPTPKTQSRKRKADHAAEQPPAKEPRLQTGQAKSRTPEPPSSDKHRIPTFASPRRQTSFSKPNQNGLGLNINSSPKAWKTTTPASDVPVQISSQFSISSSALSTGKKHNPNRRVSFTNNTPSQTRASVPPSSQASIVWPLGISKENIEQMEEVAKERETLIQEARSMAGNVQTDTSLAKTVQGIRSLDNEIDQLKDLDPKDRKLRSRYISRRKDELDALLSKFREYKATLEKEQVEPELGSESESESESESGSGSGSDSGSESESGSGSESGSASQPDGDESLNDKGKKAVEAADHDDDDEEMEDEPHQSADKQSEAVIISGDSDEQIADADSVEEEPEEEPTPEKKPSNHVSRLPGEEADDSPADDEGEEDDEEEEDSDEDEDSEDSEMKEPAAPAMPASPAKEDNTPSTLSQRAANLQAALEAPPPKQPEVAKNTEEDDSSSSSSSSDSEQDPALGYGRPPKPTTSIFDRPNPPPQRKEPLTLIERVEQVRKEKAEREALKSQLSSQQARPSVYEPVSSDVESDSDMGDVLPNGSWGKIRRPRTLR